jgi:DNA-binding NtrC family response regulator
MINIDLALVICAEGNDRDRAAAALLRCNLNPICCSNLREARTLLNQEHFCVVLCADLLSDGDYRAVLKEVRKTDKDAHLVVLSEAAECESYVPAPEDDAFDYLSCPPDLPC